MGLVSSRECWDCFLARESLSQPGRWSLDVGVP